MLSARERERYRRTIEEVLARLGRDDVGVGELTEAREGMLAVTFSRGSHTHRVELPLERLRDRDRGHAGHHQRAHRLQQADIRRGLRLTPRGGTARIQVAGATGFEPAISCVTGRCVNQATPRPLTLPPCAMVRPQ